MLSETGVHYAMAKQNGAKIAIVVDGVEGPELDQILNTRGKASPAALGAVIFTEDGKRHAYLGQIGEEYVLVVDGKIAGRGKLGTSNLGYHDMAFSPKGKHVYFIDLNPDGGRARAHLVMDGKVEADTGHQNLFPAFNADESRWAYNSTKFGARDPITIVDGKEVPYIGMDPIWLGDGKLLTPPAGVAAGGKIGAAPVGSRWAGVKAGAKPIDSKMLFIDGKVVPDALDPEEVFWSADGKRYMAVCAHRAARTKYVVTDGKKGPEYTTIVPKLTMFTPDNSRAIYVGSDPMGKRSVVVDGQPSAPITTLMGQTNPIVLSSKGNRYAYIAGEGPVFTLILDGKPVPLEGKSPVPDTMSFSPDGTRFAYVSAKPAAPPKWTVVVDGLELPVALHKMPMAQQAEEWWAGKFGHPWKHYQWSPDGKHIATYGSRDANKNAVFVDGKPVSTGSTGLNPGFLSFSADSKHLFWVGTEVSGPNPVYRVFVDGKASPVKFSGEQPHNYGTWDLVAPASALFLVFEGGAAKRYTITADPAVTVD